MSFKIEFDSGSSQKMEELENHIREKIKSLMKQKLILQKSNYQVSEKEISDQLIKILHYSICDERERYLAEEINNLVNLSVDHLRLETVLRDQKIRSQRDIIRNLQENQKIIDKYSLHKTNNDTFQICYSKKANELIKELQKKENLLFNLHSLIDQTKVINEQLILEVNNLKSSTYKMFKTQKKQFKRTKNLCITETNRFQFHIPSKFLSQQKEVQNYLKSQIDQDEFQQQKLNELAESLLQSIWAFSDESFHHPNITLDNFNENISELCNFFDSAIQHQRIKTHSELQQEIHKTIPNLQVQKGESIENLVACFVKTELDSKEKEYQRILKKAEKREKILKEKLNDSVNRIKFLQKIQVNEIDLKEIDDIKAKWEEKKQQLDESINSLKSISSNFKI